MNPGALVQSVAAIRLSGMQGTGFFVTPCLLVTAAHVVAKVPVKGRVSVCFLGQDMEATIIDKRPEHPDPTVRLPFPDVALLQFTDDVAGVTPLLLTEMIPATGASIYSRGFPVENSGFAVNPGGEDAVTMVEGTGAVSADGKRFRVKLALGQLQPGMSGAPAVLEDGHVAGVITLTRDDKSALGGFFTPTIEFVRAIEWPGATPLSSKPPEQRSRSQRSKLRLTKNKQCRLLCNTFEFIAAFFKSSLEEVKRTKQCDDTFFMRIDARTFKAGAYRAGQSVARCRIFFDSPLAEGGIAYSTELSGLGGVARELPSVVVNDQGLALQPMDLAARAHNNDSLRLTMEDVAKAFWRAFIEPLERG